MVTKHNNMKNTYTTDNSAARKSINLVQKLHRGTMAARLTQEHKSVGKAISAHRNTIQY